ncbi:MAG TPA: hypothetical protein DEO32_05805 [Ruminococcaceae bacterium]|nr:hypothetical protein [Oscillospiraceae bacterium]
MTLLISVFAAVICTVIWYAKSPGNKMMIGTLCLIYWGASIMWTVDAVFEYAKLGAEYFTPKPEEMLNDLFLGLSVTALGLIIWLVVLLIKDPRGVVKNTLFKKS